MNPEGFENTPPGRRIQRAPFRRREAVVRGTGVGHLGRDGGAGIL
jgi:hypothetical protein